MAQLRGIKIGSALMLAKEVFARELRNRRQVGALTGFVSVPYRSGETTHDQGGLIAGILHDDEHVDDRLGGKLRYGGRADVVNRERPL